MRGKEHNYPSTLLQNGITPAHAGKSIWPMRRWNCGKDHPRPCGEKPQFFVKVSPCIGSPPPMRGKGYQGPIVPICDRITPAHAGKRLQASHICLSIWDHPRPCGEKRGEDTYRDGQEGSPPPMRGKVIFMELKTEKGGITPAHAGKSSL